MIYYFIMYVWTNTLMKTWTYGECITEKHPIEWLIEQRALYATEQIGHKQVRFEYALIGWKEITKKIYDEYKDQVG